MKSLKKAGGQKLKKTQTQMLWFSHINEDFLSALLQKTPTIHGCTSECTFIEQTT